MVRQRLKKHSRGKKVWYPYTHNFISLSAENTGKIGKHWANGGGETPSDKPKNQKDIIQELINTEDNQIEFTKIDLYGLPPKY